MSKCVSVIVNLISIEFNAMIQEWQMAKINLLLIYFYFRSMYLMFTGSLCPSSKPKLVQF